MAFRTGIVGEYEATLTRTIEELRGVSDPDKFREVYNKRRGELEGIERRMVAQGMSRCLSDNFMVKLDYRLFSRGADMMHKKLFGGAA